MTDELGGPLGGYGVAGLARRLGPRAAFGWLRLYSALASSSESAGCRFRKRILGLTDGITVRFFRLIETAASQAIESGKERIELDSLSDHIVTETLGVHF